MARVFFYHNASDKLGTVCRLLSKAAAQGKRVAVFSRSDSLLDTLDRLLWTFEPTSFVPHCSVEDPLAAETPILLTRKASPIAGIERLFNLDTDIDPELLNWPAVIEVVGQEEADRLPARERFRHYKASGCELQSIDLAQARKEN